MEILNTDQIDNMMNNLSEHICIAVKEFEETRKKDKLFELLEKVMKIRDNLTKIYVDARIVEDDIGRLHKVNTPE